MHQLALSNCRGSLLHAHVGGRRGDAKLIESDTDCAGGNQNKLKAAVVQIGNNTHQTFDAANIQLSIGIGQLRGTDFEHQTAHVGMDRHGKISFTDIKYRWFYFNILFW